jgi:hypothetical protein
MAFISTIKQVLAEPTKFFRSVQKDKGYMRPWVYYILIFAVYIGVYFLTALPGSVMDVQSETQVSTAISAVFLLIAFLLLAVVLLGFLALFVHVSAAVLHLFLLVVGARMGYIQTFKIVCYASTPLIFLGPFGLFDSVPILGRLSISFAGLVISIYIIVLEVVGARVLHNLSTGRAVVGTLVLPVIIVILLVLTGIIVVISLIAASMGPTGITASVIGSIM